MARDRDPFGLALSRLREDLRDGLPPAGDPVLTTELSATLQISVTPIREAIARLAGEGLLDDRRGRGVYTFRYSAEDLEALYSLHEAYIRLALVSPSGSERRSAPAQVRSSAGATPHAFRSRTEDFWLGLMQMAEGQPILRAHQRVVDQLAVVRLAEPRILDDALGELDALIATAQTSPQFGLADAVGLYHQRRRERSRALATAAYGAKPVCPI